MLTLAMKTGKLTRYRTDFRPRLRVLEIGPIHPFSNKTKPALKTEAKKWVL